MSLKFINNQKMQIKQKIYFFIPIRLVKIRKMDNAKFGKHIGKWALWMEVQTSAGIFFRAIWQYLAN